jgi:hypothetical protein
VSDHVLDEVETTKYFQHCFSAQPCPFENPPFLLEAAIPVVDFNVSKISIKEVQMAIRKPRSSSAPSPMDRIPYIVFKKCRSLHATLKLFQECWRSGSVPYQWKHGVIKLVPKSTTAEDPSNRGKYRPIALTSCLSKLFTSVLKWQLEPFLIANSFLDSSLQKAFIPGVPGCTEHQFKLWRALQDAKEQQRSLCVAWWDLENAYGSVHHSLLQFALNHYHIPSICQRILNSLYTGLGVFIQSGGQQI